MAIVVFSVLFSTVLAIGSDFVDDGEAACPDTSNAVQGNGLLQHQVMKHAASDDAAGEIVAAPPRNPWDSPPNWHDGLAMDGCLRGGTQVKMTTTAEKAGVRCCNLEGNKCYSNVPKKDGSGNAECKTQSYMNAFLHCAFNGLRLCSPDELKRGICCETGCGFDITHVWATKQPKWYPRGEGPLALNGCPKVKAMPQSRDLSKAAVRCCATRRLGGEEVHQCYSRYWPACLDSMSFADAKFLCESYRMRLCSRAELEGNICCTKGCGFDTKHVWADKDLQITLPAPKHLATDGCWTAGFDKKGRQNKPTYDLEKAAVRCCTKNQNKCQTRKVGACDSLKEVTYDEAKRICESKNMVICHKNAMNRGKCCGTGCGFDSAHVWVDE